MASLTPSNRQLQSWPLGLAEALALLRVAEVDQPAARARLWGQGLVIDGTLDLADPRVAAVLQLPVARGRKALAEGKAQERQAAAMRARRNTERRCGVVHGC